MTLHTQVFLACLITSHRHVSTMRDFFFNFLNLLILFIYFWLCWVFVAACGLSLVMVSGGYSLVVVQRLLTGVASCWGAQALKAYGLSSCGARDQ